MTPPFPPTQSTPGDVFSPGVEYLFIILFFLRLLRDVLHNIPDLAVQNPTKTLDGVGADALISFQPGDLAWTDVVFLNEGVLADPAFLHPLPYILKTKQRCHPPLFSLDIITEYGI